MNVILYVRRTDCPHFMGDVWIIHDSQLMYGTFTSYGQHTEHSHLMVDVQNVHVSQLMYRSHLPHGRWSEHQKLTKHRQQLPKCDWNLFSYSFSYNLVVN